MNSLSVVANFLYSLFGLIDHVFPSAKEKLSGLSLPGKMFIDGMHVTAVSFPFIAGQSRKVMETRQLFLEGRQFVKIKKVVLFAAAKDQVDLCRKSDPVKAEIIYHAPEWRYPGAGANQEYILLDFFGQRKDTLRTAEGKYTADRNLFKRKAVPRPPSANTISNSKTLVPSGQEAIE